MSIEALENIIIELKKRDLRFLSVKAEPKVKLVLEDFLFVLTGMTSSDSNFDILYIDNNQLNIIEDSRYRYIIIKDADKYKVISRDILNRPTETILSR